jgi:hypothetical protein
MQRIYFCTGTSFLMGDDLSNALIEYAWALAQHRRHDRVRVPTRRADGSRGWSTLLLGPESQISTEDVTSDLAETVDPEIAANLRERTKQLRDPIPGSPFEVEVAGSDEPYESEASWDGRG